MQVYTGKNPTLGREVNQGARVVKDLVKQIKHFGRNITCDNFFTSIPLARDMLKKKLTLIGTIWKNKLGLPPQFTVAKGRDITSTIFGFQNDPMIASYCPQKDCLVNMLSTMHSLPEMASNSAEKKPEVISYYNSTKSGVDILDRKVRTYTCKRMTRRWSVALFYNMIDVSAVNAYVVWQQLHGENNRIFSKKRRRKFLIRFGKELAGMSMPKRRAIQPQSNRKRTAATENQATKAKKARCYLCKRNKDRKCRQACNACNNNICQEHSQVICTCNAITNRLKLIVSVVSICSILNTL